MRHTMGHDVAGTKKKYNPDGAPRVAREQVLNAALAIGVKVKRDGETWFYWDLTIDGWRTLHHTNYLALLKLQAMARNGK